MCFSLPENLSQKLRFLDSWSSILSFLFKFFFVSGCKTIFQKQRERKLRKFEARAPASEEMDVRKGSAVAGFTGVVTFIYNLRACDALDDDELALQQDGPLADQAKHVRGYACL